MQAHIISRQGCRKLFQGGPALQKGQSEIIKLSEYSLSWTYFTFYTHITKINA